MITGCGVALADAEEEGGMSGEAENLEEFLSMADDFPELLRD